MDTLPLEVLDTIFGYATLFLLSPSQHSIDAESASMDHGSSYHITSISLFFYHVRRVHRQISAKKKSSDRREIDMLRSPTNEVNLCQVHVWFEIISLEKFLNLSEHPVISRCVTKIIFGPDRLSPYTFGQEIKDS